MIVLKRQTRGSQNVEETYAKEVSAVAKQQPKQQNCSSNILQLWTYFTGKERL